MRDYKFRAKRRDNGEWVYGSLIDKDYILTYVDLAESWEPLTDDHKVTCRATWILPQTVGQYTGLKDKNGKEIYEGDVLRGFQKEQSDKEGKNGFDITDTVYWQGGGFKVFGKHLQAGYAKDNNILYQFMWCNHGHFNTPDHYYQLDDIEILGNIYEKVNPLADSPALNTMTTDPGTKQEEVKEEAAAGNSEAPAEQGAEETGAEAAEAEG